MSFNFKKSALVVALLASFATAPAFAATSLSLVPVGSSFSQGSSVDFDLVISELSIDSKLGSFDFNINYDPSLLGFASYSLGSGLGSIASGESMDFSLGNLGNGTIHLGQVSFLSDLAGQASSFSLGTLHFAAAGVGSSTLSFSNATFGDALGNAINVSLNSAEVNVAAVPEPETYAMFLAGLGVLGLLARRRKSLTA